MPAAKAKLSAPLAGLVLAVAVLGCGSDSSETTGQRAAPPVGGNPAEETAASARRSNGLKHRPVPKGERRGNTAEPKKTTEAAEDDLVREVARSGNPVPADSPVARKVLESITQNKGEKTKKREPLPSVVEEVISGSGGGGGSDSAGGSDGSPGGSSVDKILEQIQE